jgi:hypothetical protein
MIENIIRDTYDSIMLSMPEHSRWKDTAIFSMPSTFVLEIEPREHRPAFSMGRPRIRVAGDASISSSGA